MSQPPFERITIIGVGLMGGSMGMAIKRAFPSAEVIGVDKPQVLRRAVKRRAIDRASSNLAKAVADSDLVVFATPMSTTLRILPNVAKNCSPESTVTDLGSVKSPIMARAAKLFPNGNFIGGHPMAGVELSGIEAAHPLLFENAVWTLTPIPKNVKAHVLRLTGFLNSLGARVLLMEATTHDAVASMLSHVPQLTAVALMNVAGKKHSDARRYLKLAAGGFRDLTRIASSGFEIWRDILPLNQREIRTSLKLLVGELQRYRRSIGQNGLQRHFEMSRWLRSRIPKNMKGFVHSLPDVFVFVKDRPGMLAKMTRALWKARLNLKDLELVKVREGNWGTFRLSFESREAAAKAEKVLRRSGFEVVE